MKEVELDPKVILEIIVNTPNDMDLGKKIREYYSKILEKEKYGR